MSLEENKDMMDLYSRQIGTFGVETMKNFVTLDVLVIGLRGVGVEAAKDIILAGPRSVTIFDPTVVSISDLGANCFLNEEHVGKKRRAEACIESLSKLNPYVKVSELEGDISNDKLSKFGVVLVTDSNIGWKKLAEMGKVCHECGTTFVIGLATGITATFFSDFGDDHVITDFNGEPVIVTVATHMYVEKQEDGKLKIVVVVAKDNHGLEDGDLVQFSNVAGDGVNYLNKMGPIAVKRVYVSYDNGKRQRLVPDRFELDMTEEQMAAFVAATEAEAFGKIESNTKEFAAAAAEAVKRAEEAAKATSFDDAKKKAQETLDFAAEVLKKAGEVVKVNKFCYVNGGVVTQVKKHFHVHFKSLADSVVNPLAGTDQFFVMHPSACKMYCNAGGQLHIARRALWEFIDRHDGALPRLHNKEDADECVKIAHDICEEAKKAGPEKALVLDELDELSVRKMALYARAELTGIATFVGGVIAQEVVKKFGKFTPLQQWMHLDYFELVPNEGVRPDAEPCNSRYDSQLAVIGRAAHEKLVNQKWFMVGCGALGCEYLKGFALMGLVTGKDGLIHITDMDRIEVSNLNRQFLFRRENVGQQKSVCASNAAKVMNPAIKIQCHETKVCPETEDIFDDSFWLSLTGACNALDNMQARYYVDSRCVFYERPLLESGTLGTKCNSEIVLPHLTMSYGERKETASGEDIPMCTLRNFPYLIDHCIEWGRAQFTDIFESPVRDAVQYIENPKAFLENLSKEGNIDAQLEKLSTIKRILKVACDPKRSFETCIQLAVNEFQSQHDIRIRDLQHSFPEDACKKDPDTGVVEPFWSGTKIFPRFASFDRSNPDHVAYVMACANLYAFMYRIPQVTDRKKFEEILAHAPITLQEWVPPKVLTSEEEAEPKPSSGTDELVAQKNAAIEELEKMCAENKPVIPVPAEFEKDDDSNFHIDFITACSNMRAWNYHINPASRHEIKIIAGRIIPAIATTTAMITGAVCMEMYKLVLGLPKADFCSSNINLATMSFQFFEPDKPGEAQKQWDDIEMADVIPVPPKFTCWDKVIVDKGPLTLRQFLNIFPEVHFGCKILDIHKSGMSSAEATATANKPLYTEYPFTDEVRKFIDGNMDKPLLDVYTEIYGAPPANRNFLCFTGSFTTADDEPAKLPPIRYVFRH